MSLLRPPEKRLLLVQRALQWAAAERAADDRAAELERATETLGTSSGSGDIVAYVEAQARARVAGKIEEAKELSLSYGLELSLGPDGKIQ